MNEQKSLGTRYWTFLRYLALPIVLILLYRWVRESGRHDPRQLADLAYLGFAVQCTLAFWEADLSSWCFIMMACATSTALTGLSWLFRVGTTLGWWPLAPVGVSDHLSLDTLMSGISMGGFIATQVYFQRRRALFDHLGKPVTHGDWFIAALSSGVLILLFDVFLPGLWGVPVWYRVV